MLHHSAPSYEHWICIQNMQKQQTGRPGCCYYNQQHDFGQLKNQKCCSTLCLPTDLGNTKCAENECVGTSESSIQDQTLFVFVFLCLLFVSFFHFSSSFLANRNMGITSCSFAYRKDSRAGERVPTICKGKTRTA